MFEFIKPIKSKECGKKLLITPQHTGCGPAKELRAYAKVDETLDKLKRKIQKNIYMDDYLEAFRYLVAY